MRPRSCRAAQVLGKSGGQPRRQIAAAMRPARCLATAPATRRLGGACRELASFGQRAAGRLTAGPACRGAGAGASPGEPGRRTDSASPGPGLGPPGSAGPLRPASNGRAGHETRARRSGGDRSPLQESCHSTARRAHPPGPAGEKNPGILIMHKRRCAAQVLQKKITARPLAATVAGQTAARPRCGPP